MGKLLPHTPSVPFRIWNTLDQYELEGHCTPTGGPLHAHNPPCSLPEPFLIPSCYLPVASLNFLAGFTPFSRREKKEVRDEGGVDEL